MKRYFEKFPSLLMTRGSRGNALNSIRSIQKTLDKLIALTYRWDMDFSVNKCGVMHIEKNLVSVLDE